MLYEREDWTLFRNLATLSQKAGVPEDKIAALVAKELTDNALDAQAKCRVGLLEGNGFFVEDDGEGFDGTEEDIARLFSIHRPLTSSKLNRKPSRGALGNGLRVAVGAVLASGGSLVVHAKEGVFRLTPKDDGTTATELLDDFTWGGTRIEVWFGKSLSVNEETLTWARQAIALAAGESRYSGKSSAHWYDSDAFYEFLQAAKGQTVRAVVEEFEGCSGSKAGQISAEFKMRLASDLTRAEADQLLAEARKKARPVKPERLGSLGSKIEGFPHSYAKLAGQYEQNAARGKHKAEVPFVLEAYAEIADKAKFQVSVNRSPITGNVGANFHKDELYVSGCGLNYSFEIGRRPMRICLNIETPHMPITSDGKAPDLGPFLPEITRVLKAVVKRAKKKVAGSPEAKRPTMKDIIWGCLDESVAKASGSGEHPFSLRQLFYVIRPRVIDLIETEPEYNYFAKVITDYEAEQGDIEGLYRDARGTVYHPHTHEEIQLGTIQVENYERPPWLFKNVLYSEKEGIFPILKAAQWPERHDCALMTSKGDASRAARDLLDQIGDSVEEVRFFCIHDADAAGTMIYQALQHATKARPNRKVQIINFGLEPEEAKEMGLQIEPVKREKNQPVAEYVDPDQYEWLQENRVELNAMTTPQLLEWLDRKMAENGGKLVPPDDVLARRLELDVRSALEQQINEEVLREARVPDRVEAEFGKRQAIIQDVLETLPEAIREEFEADPSHHWTALVANVAEAISRLAA